MFDFGYQRQLAKENYRKELMAISCRKKIYKTVKNSARRCKNNFSIVISEYEWEMLGKDPYKVIDEIADAYGYIAGKPEAVPDKDLCLDYVIKFVK